MGCQRGGKMHIQKNNNKIMYTILLIILSINTSFTHLPPALLSVARCPVWSPRSPSEHWWLVTMVMAVQVHSFWPGLGGWEQRRVRRWCRHAHLAPASAALCSTSPELQGCSASAVGQMYKNSFDAFGITRTLIWNHWHTSLDPGSTKTAAILLILIHLLQREAVELN